MRNLVTIRTFFTYSIVSVLLLSCVTNRLGIAKAMEPLYGTWVDEDYGAKFILNSDGTGFVYNMRAKVPFSEIRILTDEQWTDDHGNTYYKAFVYKSTYPYNVSKTSKWYFLIRADADGDRIEWVSSLSNFPEEISKLGKYFNGIRQ